MFLRLKKRSDFLKASKSGKSIVTKGLVLQAILSNTEETPRIGFTVTKKVGNAVIRNRIKRRLRAVVSDVIGSLGQDGYDYVLIGRKSTLNREYIALTKDLRYALHKIHDQ